MNKKYIIFSIVGLAMLGLITYTTSQAYADDDNAQAPHLQLVQKLVEKFGLNQDEVEAVLDELRNERQAANQARFEERLTQAVENGKLTEEQKNAIMAKHEEMVTNQNGWEDLTPEERRVRSQEHHNEMQAWADDNGIDMNWLAPMMGSGPKHGKGFRDGYHFGADQ